ncbi:hypothetical protein SDC9_126309 [bioreactor metagenome]|uniref:Uncharacterized protein n=1 Tax=bioreactor metagenome TaxID=1076179 RepID=A0A645CQD1_9ZZZZ
MPYLVGIFTNRAVGAELCAGSNVHEALSAKGDAVAIIPVNVRTPLTKRQQLVQHKISVRLLPIIAEEQRTVQVCKRAAVVVAECAVDQRIHNAAHARFIVVDRLRVVARL